MTGFVSDGCTGWLDGWPEWIGGTGHEFYVCCAAHDVAGVTWQGNLDLLRCIADAGWPAMGAVMFIGVSTAGWFYRFWVRRIKRK